MNEIDLHPIDRELRKMTAERAKQARQASKLVGSILRAVPIRWRDEDELDDPERDQLHVELAPETLRDLRSISTILTGIHGAQLEDERLLGLLALAVLRGGRLTSPSAPRVRPIAPRKRS